MAMRRAALLLGVGVVRDCGPRVGEGYGIEKPVFDVPVTAVTALLFHLN